MGSNAERSIVLRDSERIIGGDHVQGTNATSAINSSGSTFKINTLSIDLGIVKGKGNAQKCSHFSIRGYVAKMREKSGYTVPFSDGNGEDLPPIEVPSFRYWLCQSCSQNCRVGTASQEVALVSEYGKSIVQPCSTSYTSRDCHHLPLPPFGEGTSGLKPVDKRNDDESVLTVLQGDTAQSLPDTHTNMEEPTKSDSKAANGDVKAIDVEENVLGEVNDSNQGDMVVQSDDENDDPSGHLRRKARKVRLLTELMCGNTQEKHQRKEGNLLDSGPGPCSPVNSQIKRKLPQAQDQRSMDMPTPGHAGKKGKIFKEGAASKTSLVAKNTDKHICKKHGTPKGSKPSKVSSDPLTAWRSIFNDVGRSDKLVSVGKGISKPSRDVSVPVSKSMPQLQPEGNSNASKKVVENPLRNQLLGKDIHKTNFGGSRVRDCDNGLGLGLSLHYDPQPEVPVGPSLPNRVPIYNHSSKAGLSYGESSITYRGVTLEPQAEERSFHDVRDGHTPTMPLLTGQQHYHTQLSPGIFFQHQNLDFSDPHNKRNSGVRGYSDVMGAHNHQRQEISSNGRSDEKEIAELMAKIQHERNLFEAKSYCVPGGSHDSGVSGNPIFCEANNNKGMPLTFEQYPSMRRPASSMLVTGESLNSGPTSVTNLAGFFRQEPVPVFSKFDTFSQSQKQPSNGITIPDHGHQRLNNSYYHDFRGNDNNNRIALPSGPTNMREAFNEHHNGQLQNGTPRNLWSNIPSGQNMGIHTNWSNKKGKSIINLDLNVTASNGVEEQNELNPKHMGSLGSSYSNEAIPAMQLLSLMDAGNSNSTFVMDGKKFKAKPFLSCYNHHNSNAPGKPNSYLPNSGRQSGVQKPMENPRNLIHGASPLSAVTNSFSSFFHTDQTVEGHTNGRQFYLEPEPKKPKGVSTGLPSHKYYRPDDSFVFPLPWHAAEDRNGNVAQVALQPRNVTPGTEICTINQNPADFSTPEPGNVYMIGVEDLQFKGEPCYKSKLASGNIDVQKWQIRS
nr:protein EMBRYONIC FLOWER 1 isoform X2 [Erigeron canadensis]